MDIESLFARLLPVFGALALATVIEALAPLRQQSRKLHGRLVTNFCLLVITLALGILLNFALALGAGVVRQSGLGLLQILGLGASASFVAAFLALDGASYLVHRLMHQ